MNIDREKLAALAHEQWSGWMRYMFNRCARQVINNYYDNTKEVIIPGWAVERWTRQMNTPYEDLPEEEKESDRNEADRVIQLIKESNNESK